MQASIKDYFEDSARGPLFNNSSHRQFIKPPKEANEKASAACPLNSSVTPDEIWETTSLVDLHTGTSTDAFGDALSDTFSDNSIDNYINSLADSLLVGPNSTAAITPTHSSADKTADLFSDASIDDYISSLDDSLLSPTNAHTRSLANKDVDSFSDTSIEDYIGSLDYSLIEAPTANASNHSSGASSNRPAGISNTPAYSPTTGLLSTNTLATPIVSIVCLSKSFVYIG